MKVDSVLLCLDFKIAFSVECNYDPRLSFCRMQVFGGSFFHGANRKVGLLANHSDIVKHRVLFTAVLQIFTVFYQSLRTPGLWLD